MPRLAALAGALALLLGVLAGCDARPPEPGRGPGGAARSGSGAPSARRAGRPRLLLRYRYLTDSPGGQIDRRLGFDLADTGPFRSVIDRLPAGQRALVWIGPYDPATCSFAISAAALRRVLAPLAADPKVAGYYIADEADDALPGYGGHCPDVAAQVRARSRLVHRLAPGAFTYEVVTEPGNFAAFATATDVLGADPYPCRAGGGCDWSMIPRYIAALTAARVARYWGVLQAFSAGPWRYPTPLELRTMIRQWARSRWQGAQTFAWSYAGHSLARHPGLLAVLRAFNVGKIGPGSSRPGAETAATPTRNARSGYVICRTRRAGVLPRLQKVLLRSLVVSTVPRRSRKARRDGYLAIHARPPPRSVTGRWNRKADLIPVI
ncbi:MAG: hypothetical protein M0030_22900 [Actinomycetota bacterium]|nr:hypothetical protein [Actinomycetota bacterium]